MKNQALEKVNMKMNELKKVVNDTLVELPFREGNLKIITNHVKDTGNGLYESTYFNVIFLYLYIYLLLNVVTKFFKQLKFF